MLLPGLVVAKIHIDIASIMESGAEKSLTVQLMLVDSLVALLHRFIIRPNQFNPMILNVRRTVHIAEPESDLPHFGSIVVKFTGTNTTRVFLLRVIGQRVLDVCRGVIVKLDASDEFHAVRQILKLHTEIVIWIFGSGHCDEGSLVVHIRIVGIRIDCLVEDHQWPIEDIRAARCTVTLDVSFSVEIVEQTSERAPR